MKFLHWVVTLKTVISLRYIVTTEFYCCCYRWQVSLLKWEAGGWCFAENPPHPCYESRKCFLPAYRGASDGDHASECPRYTFQVWYFNCRLNKGQWYMYLYVYMYVRCNNSGFFLFGQFLSLAGTVQWTLNFQECQITKFKKIPIFLKMYHAKVPVAKEVPFEWTYQM